MLSADLIADIYEAAVDDERWPRMAQIVASGAGMTGTAVWCVDQGQVVDMSVTEDLLATRDPYVAHYGKLDPWQQRLIGRPWEQVHLGHELFSERDLAKTEFYNDFARPNEIRRPMGAMMRLGRGTFATVAANRPADKKMFAAIDKPQLARLVPHLRRALQLRLAQRKHALGAPIHAEALDALAFGVVVCDATGRVVVTNKAAEALAGAGAGITLGRSGKGLGAGVPAEARALAVLVNDAASGGPGGIIRLTGRDGGTQLIALVTPLPRSFGFDRPAGHAYALVTLRSAWDSPSFSADMLIALFHVSPAQAEIALAIYNGKTPDQIAAERGVAISTLRTHLAEIFLRTGAENQRDLVRLLGTLPPVRAQSLGPDN